MQVERVCIGSFSLTVLQTVRALEPRLPTSAAREEGQWSLYRSWVGLPLGTTPVPGFPGARALRPAEGVSRRFIRAAHRAGLPVQVWTVNEEPDMWRLLDWGVDALISDRPDLAVRVQRRLGRGATAMRTPSPVADWDLTHSRRARERTCCPRS